MFKLLPAILLFSVAVGTVSAVTDKVVCYWGTWSVYRWGNGLFTVDDIDPTLCTHVIYTFVGIQGHDGNVRLLDSYLDIDRKNLQRFNELKNVNANLKTLIAIGGWIARGADPQKLVLGLGVYGRSFSLASASNNQLGAPVTGGGNAGKYTRESGMIGYNEIVELQNEGGWTEVWDDVQKVPHMYKGNQWIGYDNPMSITLKVEYAKSLNLGGAMIWSFETDDFKGLSGTKYPILKTINAALKGSIPPPEPQPTVAPTAAPSVPDVTEQPTEEPSAEPTVEPTAQPTAEPTAQPTAEPTAQPTAEPTADPGTDGSNTTSGDEKVGLCEREGYIRDPDNCAVFYYCLPHKGEFVALRQHCNEGLLYDEQLNACNYPEQVQC
nr:chitinase [Microdera punctipennis]